MTTITQALLLFADIYPEHTAQCLDLVKHIELGDRELYTKKAQQFISRNIDSAPDVPQDVRARIMEALGSANPHRLVSLSEYAEMHGKNPANIRQRIIRGNLPAVKSASTWLIYADEPLIDKRRKHED